MGVGRGVRWLRLPPTVGRANQQVWSWVLGLFCHGGGGGSGCSDEVMLLCAVG